MKKILLKNPIYFQNEKIFTGNHIIIDKNIIKIMDYIKEDENYYIIDCSDKVVIPSLPVFKTDIFDINTYKYLNKFDNDFRMNKSDFEKLPFEIIEKISTLIAQKLKRAGSSFFFYSHMSYQLIKNSLITISNILYNTSYIRTSLSYQFNKIYPEQEILSIKENQSYSEYCKNQKTNYRFYHKSLYLSEIADIKEFKPERITFLHVQKNIKWQDLENYIKQNENIIFFILFENPFEIINYNENFNTFLIIPENYFSIKEISNFLFSILESNIESKFILSPGYNNYNIFNSLFYILRTTLDIRVKYLIRNQLKILPKAYNLITLLNTGEIDNDYIADLTIIDTKYFEIFDFDSFLDFLIQIYLETPVPEFSLFDGHLINFK